MFGGKKFLHENFCGKYLFNSYRYTVVLHCALKQACSLFVSVETLTIKLATFNKLWGNSTYRLPNNPVLSLFSMCGTFGNHGYLIISKYNLLDLPPRGWDAPTLSWLRLESVLQSLSRRVDHDEYYYGALSNGCCYAMWKSCKKLLFWFCTRKLLLPCLFYAKVATFKPRQFSVNSFFYGVKTLLWQFFTLNTLLLCILW